MPIDARRVLLQRLRADLMGPGLWLDAPQNDFGELPEWADEAFSAYPTDRYVTGVLAPRDVRPSPEEDDEYGSGDGGDDVTVSGRMEAIRFGNILRPSSCGLSFALRSSANPRVKVTIRCGIYRPTAALAATGATQHPFWVRVPHEAVEVLDVVVGGMEEKDTSIPHLKVYMKAERWNHDFLVTVAVSNTAGPAKDKQTASEQSFFQVEVIVEPMAGSELVARPRHDSSDDNDTDSRSAALIYRDKHEYAIGHTCSATWDDRNGGVRAVRTSWIPDVRLLATSAAGDPVFAGLRAAGTRRPLSARWLSEAGGTELSDGLSLLTDAYASWLESQRRSIGRLEPAFQSQAATQLANCDIALTRMRGAIDLLRVDDRARMAFALAQKAVLLQRLWGNPTEQDLEWRPFQLGFQLLTLASLANPDHDDRDVVDLLWFPTGGGKTEAYLALTAFVLFLRRLRQPDDPDAGAGVAVLMRYTLRLLTIQQFQRASRLICACELLRLGADRPSASTGVDLGDVPFSIGLWVGGDATPNKREDARDYLLSGKGASPCQILGCPACGGQVVWQPGHGGRIECSCRNQACELASRTRVLPVYTVDEDVYEVRPSLVIGTVDKFAQITRSPALTANLFGIDTPNAPPEFIIQDELHLISGPLGTIAGLYEMAVDGICARDGIRPKVIGSTATIRRAAEQIAQLFDRRAYQFPPPALDASNSCFACVDEIAPGRLYVGVTTAGRSAKLVLGAVSASLLQGASDARLPDSVRDYYWTLLAYFNTLRELGGALVLMQDDVEANLPDYADRWKEPEPRHPQEPEELTSRRSSAEIPAILETLGASYPDPAAYDIVLASNMISVGVDIPRLGLMVLHGQPKTVAEYIQATSRVGRNLVPGLVVTIYNNGKVRDRAHFESFRTWHETLYRDVEPTSVTPFAPRAQDRALHAALVALVRHLDPKLRRDPRRTREESATLERLAAQIAARAARQDPEEQDSVRRRLQQIIDQWLARLDQGANEYWANTEKDAPRALMVGAELYAAIGASSGRRPLGVWSTLNSMREVEPSTRFVACERLRPAATAEAVAEARAGDHDDMGD